MGLFTVEALKEKKEKLGFIFFFVIIENIQKRNKNFSHSHLKIDIFYVSLYTFLHLLWHCSFWISISEIMLFLRSLLVLHALKNWHFMLREILIAKDWDQTFGSSPIVKKKNDFDIVLNIEAMITMSKLDEVSACWF